MGTISIEGMEFFAYHGCFKEEQIIGTRFTVDLFMETSTMEAENSDDLSKTVNYQAVYGLVAEEMAVKSKLLENVARRILDRIAQEFPRVTATRLRISKMNPPVGGKVERVSVELRAAKRDQEPSICPRCGKAFSCSKSGKCWCYEVYLPLDKLEEIESLYDSCLCPSCLNEYAKPLKPGDGNFSRDSLVFSKKQKPHQ